MKCTKCGTTQAKYSLGKDVVCDSCLEEASLNDSQCPNCGQKVDMQTEQVAMTLQREGTKGSKGWSNGGGGLPVLIVVCPTCHILFMDQFQYDMLKAAPI